MENKKVIYTCNEHVEIAIDDYINECDDGKAPNIDRCSEKVCNYCENIAEYKISE